MAHRRVEQRPGGIARRLLSCRFCQHDALAMGRGISDGFGADLAHLLHSTDQRSDQRVTAHGLMALDHLLVDGW
jgi:hypothetical protein